MPLRLTTSVLLLATASCIDLDSLYSADTKLTAGSEYIVNDDVLIDNGVIFEIGKNVIISFNGSYTISVEGELIIGCNDTDTSTQNSVQGIADESTDILIKGDINNNGQITIESSGSASICNTYFKNLEYGLYILSSSNDILIDNCEFDGISTDAIYLDTSGTSSNIIITDNKFMNNDQSIARGYQTYGNLLIENNLFSSNYFQGTVNVDIGCCWNDGSAVRNNIFTCVYPGDTFASGLTVSTQSLVYVEYNQFMHCYNGLYFWNNDGYVRYNTFIGNERGINIYQNESPDKVYINYNNFIDVTYSFWTNVHQYGKFTHCNYNYFGTNSTEQSVVSAQIAHICLDDGVSTSTSHNALIIWWPWFIQPIDFNQLPENTSAVTFEPDLLYCMTSGTVSSGTKLQIYYDYGTTWGSSNLTLTTAGSPYYAKNDVRISESIAFIVEPGVEIILSSDEGIYPRGSININCGFDGKGADSKLDRKRGLSNITSSVTIRGSYGRGIGISSSTIGPVSICNTKFDGIRYGLGISYNGDFMIDNCEFYGLKDGINLNVANTASKNITDCIFHNVEDPAIHSEDGVNSNLLIENNLFTSSGDSYLGRISFNPGHSNCYIRNNTFIYTGNTAPSFYSDVGIRLSNRNYMVYVEYNTFINFAQGIFVYTALGSIKYNTFINNTWAIQISDSVQGEMEINYNNFIDNNYSIVLNDDYLISDPEQNNCNYNYYGTSSTDPNVVYEQIYDNCRYQPDVLIKWYPFFNEKIDFNSLPLNSSAIDIEQGELECITLPPTSSPTDIYVETDCYNETLIGQDLSWSIPIFWTFSIPSYNLAVTFDSCQSVDDEFNIDIFKDGNFSNPLQASYCGDCLNCPQSNYLQRYTIPLSAGNYTILGRCSWPSTCDYELKIFGCGTNSTLSPSPATTDIPLFNVTNYNISGSINSTLFGEYNTTNNTVSDGSEPTGIPTRTPISIPSIPCGITPYECSNGKLLLPYYSVEQGKCIYDPCFTPSPSETAGNGNKANTIHGLSVALILIMSFCIFL